MRPLLFFWALATLGGCALSPVPTAPVARPTHPESAPFTMDGRMSINHRGERHSAGLHWTHREQSDEILLLTPLGQTAARVYRDAGHATLDDGNRHYQDVDAESLMQQVLGWHLPLLGLHQWVLGLPVANTPAQIEHNNDGQVSALRQEGWEVHYLRYADSQPTRMQLNHEDLQIQLLIDGWEWNPQ